jgi:hypothetical protein
MSNNTSDVPTLREVREAVQEVVDALDTHAASLQMTHHALHHIESSDDPQRIAKVLDEIVSPHLSEQIQALKKLAERIPTAEGGAS